MTSQQPDILVIGAGVSGLTTAICLAEAGSDVTVAAADLPLLTTSAAAGAIWGPHLVGMDDRVARWGRLTLDRLTEMAADPATGVRLATGIAASRTGQSEPIDWVTAWRARGRAIRPSCRPGSWAAGGWPCPSCR